MKCVECSAMSGILNLQWNSVSGAANYKMQWARADLNYGDTTDTTGGTERTTSSTSGNTFGLKQKTWFKLHSRVESATACSVPGT